MIFGQNETIYKVHTFSSEQNSPLGQRREKDIIDIGQIYKLRYLTQLTTVKYIVLISIAYIIQIYYVTLHTKITHTYKTRQNTQYTLSTQATWFHNT